MALQDAISRRCQIHPSLIAPHAFPGQGNGVLAKAPIEKDDLLISIPRDLLFSTNTVVSTPSLRRIIEKSIESPVDGKLTALEALCLGAPELVERAVKRITKISRLHKRTLETFQKYINSNCPEEVNCLEALSLDAFKWAYATVMSRSVFVRCASLWSSDIQLHKDTAALPPWLDLFNHSNETDCSGGYNAESGCYELRTLQSWQSGEQVFIKYGSHSNATLLMHYGFAIPDNVYESLRLNIDFEAEFQSQGELGERKLTLLNQYGLLTRSISSYQANKAQKHELTRQGLGWNTMVALKTMLLDGASGAEDPLEDWSRLLEDVPISERNETAYRSFCEQWYRKSLADLEHAEKLSQSTSFPTDSAGLSALASTYRASMTSLIAEMLRSLS